MIKEYNKLINAKLKYDSEVCNFENKLSSKIDFEFSIFWQPSDGFVILDLFTHNAYLFECLKTIKEFGKLSHDDYLRLCI